MTLQEFKAWFEGFTEAFGANPPTTKQWKRIRERVAEISSAPYVWHYSPEPPRYYWHWNGLGTTAATPLTASNATYSMTDLGRADAASLEQ